MHALGKLLNRSQFAIGQWIKTYRTRGLNGLLYLKYRGGNIAPSIPVEIQAQLKEQLSHPDRVIGYKPIRRWFEETQGLEFPYSTVFGTASYLRPRNIDGAKHAWAMLALLVNRLRQAWPAVRLIIRGDSGFCRWRLLQGCDRHQVGYLIGLAKNRRLNALAQPLLAYAERLYHASDCKQRLFSELTYGAATWDRPRRVIVKAEHGPKGSNPRYVVTNLPGKPHRLYREQYCARGDMENRIKEQ